MKMATMMQVSVPKKMKDSEFENFVIETLGVNQTGIKDEIYMTAVIDTEHCTSCS